MALWTPANLAVQPRRIRFGPNATFIGGNLTGWANTGSDGGNGSIAGPPTQGALYGGVQSVRYDAAAEQISHTLGAWSSGALSTFWFGKRLGTGINGYFGKGWFGAGSAVGYLGSGIANFGSAHFGNGNGALGPQFKTAADVVDTATPHIVAAKLGSVNSLHVDGVAQALVGSVTGLVPNYTSAAWVGGNSGANGEHANADEIVGMEFDYALSDGDRQKLEGWIAWATGWQALLPASHPYKAAAPTTAGGAPAASTSPLAHDSDWLALRASSPYWLFAWWHVFRRSIDNLAPASDFYTTRMLNPTDPVYSGSGGTKGYGAWIPDRPSGRAPLAGADWQRQDAQFWCEQAWAVGIDGFQHNIISAQVGSADYNDIGNNLEGALRCTNAGKPFWIMLMLDGATLSGTSTAQIVAAVRAHMDHARMFRHPDGRLMLGSFAPDLVFGLQKTKDIVNGIAAGTAGVFFVPQYLNSGLANDASWSKPSGPSDGSGVWGGNVFSTQPGLATIGGQVKTAGRTWMPTIFPQDYRPKEHMVREAGGSALYRLAWDNAIATRDSTKSWLASIACWNDYTENQMCPGEPGLGVQEGFYRLTAYYAHKYKNNGVAPTITRDQLFYFHRREHTGGYNGSAGTGSAQPGPFIHDPSNNPADAYQNNVELVALLASPARIRITLGASSTFADVGSGLQRLTVPWAGNVTPVFSLERGGATLLTLQSAFPTRTQSQYQDLHYKAGVSEPFSSGTGSVGQADGSSTIVGSLKLRVAMVGASVGASSVAGAGAQHVRMVGTASGASAAEGSPIVAPDTIVMVGASAGASSPDAALMNRVSMVGAAVGDATVDGVEQDSVLARVVGATSGESAVAGALQTKVLMIGVSSGASVSGSDLLLRRSFLMGGLSGGTGAVVGVLMTGVLPPIDIDPKFLGKVRLEKWLISVPKEPWLVKVGKTDMLVVLPPKDPDDVSKRGLNWAEWLEGDSIVFSNWTVLRSNGALIVSQQEFDTGKTTIMLAGGSADRRYILTNRIRTLQGRQRDVSVSILIAPE